MEEFEDFSGLTVSEFINRFGDHIAFARYRGLSPQEIATFLIEYFYLQQEPESLAGQIRTATSQEDYRAEIAEWRSHLLGELARLITEDYEKYGL